MFGTEFVSFRQTRLGSVALVMAGVVSLLAAGPARAAGVEFEDWGTQFSPTNPIQCNVAGCQVSTSQANISPTGMVDRVATIKQVASGEVLAQTLPAGGCATGAAEGCLRFHSDLGTAGSLFLDYRFHDQQDLNNVTLLVANTDEDPFAVAAFFFDGSQFSFADQYVIQGNTHGYFKFDFPQDTLTNEVLLIYNPTSASGLTFSQTANGDAFYSNPDWVAPHATKVGADLCCVMANVPEPDTWSMMLLGVFSIGAVMRAGRSRRRMAAA